MLYTAHGLQGKGCKATLAGQGLEGKGKSAAARGVARSRRVGGEFERSLHNSNPLTIWTPEGSLLDSSRFVLVCEGVSDSCMILAGNLCGILLRISILWDGSNRIPTGFRHDSNRVHTGFEQDFNRIRTRSQQGATRISTGLQ